MRTMFFLLVLLFVSTFQFKSIEADELTKTEKELIAWMDKLGYQDLSKLPLVNVATGRWYKNGDEPEKSISFIGFLAVDNGADFTVVDLTGQQSTYTKNVNVAPFKAVFFERVDLKEVVKARIEYEKKRKSRNASTEFTLMTSESFKSVFLARACASQGFNKEAHDLFELADLQ